MKKLFFYFIVILYFVLFNESIASINLPLKLTVQSKEEDKLNGRVTLQIMAEALDSIYLVDTRFKSYPREDHPLFSSLGVPSFVKYKLFTKADLFSLSYTLVYDQNEQPYHPQEVEFEGFTL
jgi:hypothetical protein